MKCHQEDCNEPAVWRYTWPGRTEQGICDRHRVKAKGVADVLGMELEFILVESEGPPCPAVRTVLGLTVRCCLELDHEGQHLGAEVFALCTAEITFPARPGSIFRCELPSGHAGNHEDKDPTRPDLVIPWRRSSTDACAPAGTEDMLRSTRAKRPERGAN